MIDRDARNRLATLIRKYLDDQLMAFDFDEALDEFRESGDDTVRIVSDAVLCFYFDDCDDHLVALTKPEWNYFQRLLLLIESNSRITSTHHWHWTYSQLVAFVLLLLLLGIVFQTGFGHHLMVLFIPFGAASIAISHFRHSTKEAGPYEAIVYPFKSFGDLEVTYENTHFQKARYPSKLNSRSIRSPFTSWFWKVLSYICCTMVAPISLFVQCFPAAQTQVKIDPA